MKPQSMKARKAMKKSEESENNDDTCFDFNEFLVALDATEPRVEIPTGSSSAYDFTSLLTALSVAEEDNKAEEKLKFHEALMKFPEESRCDIASLLKELNATEIYNKANEARLKFREVKLKIQEESRRNTTNLLKALRVAEVDNKTKEARQKFEETMLKIRNESRRENRVFRGWRHILSEYHSELGLGKSWQKDVKQNKLKVPILFRLKHIVSMGDSRRRRDTTIG